ncbi:MAG: nucleotidyltransferase domain-containing protein [Patescibacteria group bacterium]
MRKNPPKKFKKTKVQFINPAQKAIFDTLRYRQIFDCSMSYYQIWNYLVSNKPTSEQDFKDALDNLVKDKKIICKDGWYSINVVDHEKAALRRKQAGKLMRQAINTVKHLKQIPWIEMVAVTGSVAAFNANEQSDIDILVVTKPKRLWLTRLFLVSTLKILGVYWNAKEPAGTICPNILITAGNLTWESKKQNLYTANEVSLLCPLFFRHNCYFDFLEQNEWIKNYLPNFHIPDGKVQTIRKPRFAGKVIDIIELATMKLQMFYMKNKKTTEVVSRDFAHFNTHDASTTILQKFGRA